MTEPDDTGCAICGAKPASEVPFEEHTTIFACAKHTISPSGPVFARIDTTYYESVYVIASVDTGSDDGACVQIAIEKDGKIEIVAERHGKTADEAARAFAQTKGLWSSTPPTSPGVFWWQDPSHPPEVVHVFESHEGGLRVNPPMEPDGAPVPLEHIRGRWWSEPIAEPPA